MLIFISGAINSGKSTVAKLLAKKIPNTANVEIDSLHDFIAWQPIDEAVPINLENAALIIKNFLSHGYNVVAPYPLSEKNYEYMKEQLNDQDGVYFFTLAPDIKKAQKGSPERTLSEWEKERIQHHYDIGIAKPLFGKIIDNTNQTPQETVEQIIKEVKKDFK